MQESTYLISLILNSTHKTFNLTHTNSVVGHWVYESLRCPDEAIRTPIATTNITNMLTSNT